MSRVDSATSFSQKDEVLLSSVLLWFNAKECRVQTFSDIVHRKNGLSLRIIDWLITNFTKSFSVAIESDGLPRNLRRDYHKNLSAHNKKNFDPFARRRRIRIVLFGKEERVSTIGQLNFFRWFLSKNLVEFVLENKSVIEKHMKDSLREVAQMPSGKDRRQGKGKGRGNGTGKGKGKSKPKPKPKGKSNPKPKPGVCAAQPQLFSGSFRMSFFLFLMDFVFMFAFSRSV